ncbi:MAG: hypothetical protein AUI63_07930 [Gemmatimonadetes bacterium 13_1_40CM_2_60_3]|nr:MAG: hypothetical protein AUI63_07930 [Gemmatimonadetes bacterium 13_1_40CM_2_60_3]
MHRPITATDVLKLVNKSSPYIELAPLSRIGRQENRRTQQAAGYRHKNMVIEKDFHRPADAGLSGEGAKRGVAFEPWYPAAPHTSQSPNSISQ